MSLPTIASVKKRPHNKTQDIHSVAIVNLANSRHNRGEREGGIGWHPRDPRRSISAPSDRDPNSFGVRTIVRAEKPAP